MNNSHKFFKNQECEYFPCHSEPKPGDFNCLFCFCPLYYPLGDKCGGSFTYNAKGVKKCDSCHLPHTPEYFEVIVAKLKEVQKPHLCCIADEEKG